MVSVYFRAMSFWSHTWLQESSRSIYLSECHFWSHPTIIFCWRPYIEESHLLLDIEGSLPFRPFNQIIRPKRSRGEKSHKLCWGGTITFHMVSWTYHWKEMPLGKPGRFSLFSCPDIPFSISTSKHSSLFSYAPSSFINLEMRFLLRRDGCNTSCYQNTNLLH
jgi:hypothetical protein